MSARHIAASTCLLAALWGCQGTPAAAPSPSPSASEAAPSAEPTPEPTPSCAAPLQREDGTPIYAVSLAGYGAVNGLDVKGSGSSATLTEPMVTLRLAAYPGSAAVSLKSGSVTFEVNGQKGAPQPITFDAVTLPPGPSAGDFGSVQTVNFTLPANAIKGSLGADPSHAMVVATVSFKDDQGADVLNENLDPLAVNLPLQTGTTTTPAVNLTLLGCGAP